MNIDIIDSTKYFNSQEKRVLKHQVQLILKHLNLPSKTEVCITFVDDTAMRELNETYRGIKRTTDVLSFPQGRRDIDKLNAAIANYKKILLGDIVISVKTAEKNAKQYKNSMKKEIQKLIIHGTLHLLGYNHKKKNEAEKMREKEKELLMIIENPRSDE